MTKQIVTSSSRANQRPIVTRITICLLFQVLGTFCCSVVAAQSDKSSSSSWSLETPIKLATELTSLEPEIHSGPFQFDAQISLAELDGTAASIRFGDQLNFGFDSRSGTFFVDGPIVGRTKLLQDSDTLIQPNKPFKFSGMRSEGGAFQISINDQALYSTKKLRGKIGQVFVRPMRNSVSVDAASIHGNLRILKEGIHLETQVTPILNDASLQSVVQFRIKTNQKKTLKQIALRFENTTTHGSIDRITISKANLLEQPIVEIAAPIANVVHAQAGFELEPGTYDFSINCVLNQKARLLDRIGIGITSIEFDDGTVWQPISGTNQESGTTQRVGYCIHKKMQHNCHTFRIPAITRTSNGTLLAVYDMRYNSSRDLQEHIDIGLSRSTDGGETWSEPIPIMDMGEFGGKPQKENGCSDPGILVDSKTGEIFVSAVWTFGKPNTHQWVGKGSEPGFEIGTTAQFMVVRSKDDGVTWTSPENWTKMLKQESWWLFAPAPGNGITLEDGTLVIPTQGRDETGLPFSNITYSRDHGKTWTVSKHARSNTTECSVAELSDGRLMLNMRDNRNRQEKGDNNGRAVAITGDFGNTWTTHGSDHGALPEPVCMASLISHRLPDGRKILLFSNPNDKHKRRRMTIQLSFDDGTSWPESNRILLDEVRGAYSSLVMVDDATVGILYESSRADLVFQKVKISDLLNDSDSLNGTND